MLVVVHTATEALLLKRADHRDFWQSVTGALEWGETTQAAALRELHEETGINNHALRGTGIIRSYEIFEEWKKRYPPNSVYNREHLFFCELGQRVSVQLNPQEHTDYQWLDIGRAGEIVYSWSNRLALKSLG